MKKRHFQRKNIIMAGVGIALAISCVIYGILIYGTGSGTGFFLVWIAMAAGFLIWGLLSLCGIWEMIPRILLRLLVSVLVIGTIIFLAVEIMIVKQMNDSGKVGLDYIIVLGAQVREDGPSAILKYRLDRAAEYLEENPDTICIVSGGQGDNEPFPEAEGMAEYLRTQGIGNDRLILERESDTTEENIRNSMKMMDRGSDVGIVTNNFHVFRAIQIAQQEGLENACGIAAGSPPLYLPNNMLREFFAEIKFLVF